MKDTIRYEEEVMVKNKFQPAITQSRTNPH